MYTVILSQMNLYNIKVQNQGEGQYSFSLQIYIKFSVQIRNFESI